MCLANKLKALRKKAGFTQKDLADLLDVVPSAIGMYEQNRRVPDLGTVIKLSKIFNVSTDVLLGLTSEDNVEYTHHQVETQHSEFVILYEQLDLSDQAEIRGEIKGMLRHEKYATMEERKQHA